ncbi:hypothetical protein LAV_00180 [Sphingobium phage Lacusarx]|uniref:Uncharacterized protein n=1 Tax=Sphingobium phage Lacusarx TaxID=1980139 RepID=A0A1W6DXC6_9CAUD|nr:hypothetical protein FDH44_gp123 [Sphingobium phage Lacusarx]ARK07555.1 hypothetical protein LAV_00180 [Sphingobium phage Lacusarx]
MIIFSIAVFIIIFTAVSAYRRATAWDRFYREYGCAHNWPSR